MAANRSRYVEENGHPYVFLYTKNAFFTKKGEENSHPRIFLYTKNAFFAK